MSITSGHQALAADVISPEQWLEKMSAAMQTLNFQGVYVYRSANEFTAMKVIHLVDKQGRTSELLETLSGDQRRNLKILPQTNPVAVGLLGQIGRVHGYYTLALLGTDRVAGRPSQLIAVHPKDKYRYGYQLWLDQATGLLLKSDLLNHQGEPLEQIMFTSLELIPAEQRDRLIETEGIGVIADASVSSQPSGKIPWVVSDLPKGFVLLNSNSRNIRDDIEHKVYSDGLASVSVFVEKNRPESEAFVGFSRMGAVSAFGSIESGYQVTVVGDVPEITVKTICKSIRIEDVDQ